MKMQIPLETEILLTLGQIFEKESQRNQRWRTSKMVPS